MAGTAIRLVTVLLVAALALASWSIRVTAADPWTKVVSTNFEVIGDARPERIRELAHRLEQFRTAIGMLLPTVKLKAPVPTLVYLFRNDAAFRPFKPRRKGKILDNVGGYFQRDVDANVMVLPADGGGFETALRPLFHEYTHFVLHNNVPRMPAWLDEGLAEYYSTFTIEADGTTGSIGSPIAGRIATMRDRTPLPLSRLLVIDRRSKEYTDKSTTPVFYAQSWALVHYLILGEGGRRRPMLDAYVRQIASGASAEASATAAFGSELAAIEDGLASYVRKRAFPVLNLTFKTSIGTEGLAAGETMPAHEVSARLAGLSLLVRQVEDAGRHLDKARTSAPEDALVRITRAKFLLAKDDGAGALKELEPIVAQQPSVWVAHALRGRALMQMDRDVDAAAAFRIAAEAKPDLAWIQVSLGIACSTAGRDDDAVAAFAAAEQLEPRNSDVLLSRAHVFSRRGMWSKAAADADAFVRMEGWEHSSAPYMALVSYFCKRLAGDNDGAKRLLDEAATQLEPKTWPEPVFSFLQKRLSEADLLKTAEGVDEKTEAYAYAGLARIADGDVVGGRKHLEWVLANGNRNFTEYLWARALIARLDAPAAR